MSQTTFYVCNTYDTNKLWMILNKKFNRNKRIQNKTNKENNLGEVKTNGGDFRMIYGGLSTLFILVVQVSHVCHQPNTFSPAWLYNSLLCVSFQYVTFSICKIVVTFSFTRFVQLFQYIVLIRWLLNFSFFFVSFLFMKIILLDGKNAASYSRFLSYGNCISSFK